MLESHAVFSIGSLGEGVSWAAARLAMARRPRADMVVVLLPRKETIVRCVAGHRMVALKCCSEAPVRFQVVE